MLSSKGCKVRRPKVTLKLKPHNQIGKSTPHHSCSPNSAAAQASQPSIFSGPSASSVLSGALPSLPYDGSNKQPRSVADLRPHDASFKGDHRSPPGVPPSTHTIQRILQDNTVGTIMASSKRPGTHAGDNRSPPIRPPGVGKQDIAPSPPGIPVTKYTQHYTTCNFNDLDDHQ